MKLLNSILGYKNVAEKLVKTDMWITPLRKMKYGKLTVDWLLQLKTE